jgi:predicted small secreted protein
MEDHMRKTLITLLASAAVLSGCNTVRGAAADVESVANAFDPNVHYAVCGTYGMLDRNGDGRISRAEWVAYGPAEFASWDANHNGRIGKGEFSRCWYGGGFWNTYNRSNWEPAFAALDLNGDGVITPNEFFGAATWARLDPNNTGFITAWPWS